MKKIIALGAVCVLVGVLAGRWSSFQKNGMNIFPPSYASARLKPLKIENLKFDTVASVDKGVIFSKEDTVVFSYELSGLVALNPADKKNNSFGKNNKKEDAFIHIRQDLMVRDTKGNILIVKPQILEVKRILSEKPARFVNEISLKKIPTVPNGKYEIDILVTDLVGFQTAGGALIFNVAN